MSRLPVRTRLVLAFVAVMAVVLAATGLFVHRQLGSELDETVDRELSARLAGVVAIVRDDGDDLGHPRDDPLRAVDADGVVQVLDRDGDVAGATTPELSTSPILPVDQLRGLTPGQTVDADVEALGERLRFVAAPAVDDRVRYLVVVGASLEQRQQALADLARVLLIGGPIALLLAALAGYGVATGALRPVEAMRRRAADLFASGDTGERLPVSPARDEISNLGTTLNTMLSRVDQALARERAFVADASHELRTPLSVLKTEVDLALEGDRSQPELEAALESVAEETDRLTRLAEDLLVLARADEGRLPISVAPVDLDALTRRVSERFQTRAQSQGREIHVDAAGVHAQGDALRLEQVVTNLVDNALRYGAGNPIVRGVRRNGHVEIHVIDEGAGLPDGAFDRFAGSTNGGAGLGLAIVDAIARAHGGTAHAETPPEGGTDVWVTLPAEP